MTDDLPGLLVSSVLVVFVLLGMWAFVLVPLVRQRSVKADEIRSVARFSSALRVLSRGHSVAERSAFDWVMPPREGLAAVRQRRLAAAASRRPVVASVRRRRLMTGLAAAVTFTLLLVLVAGRRLIVLQLLSDCAFVAGILACRWSVAQEQAVAARSRRRRDTYELRSSLYEVSDGVPVMTAPLHRAGPITMTVPLDAPAQSRRAVPPVPAPAPRRPAEVLAASAAAVPPRVARATPRPRAAPVVLAEIDLDWEPAVPEPQSCVRLVDLGGKTRRPRIFEESPADGVEVGDDAELDALVQRRLTASGW